MLWLRTSSGSRQQGLGAIVAYAAGPSPLPPSHWCSGAMLTMAGRRPLLQTAILCRPSRLKNGYLTGDAESNFRVPLLPALGLYRPEFSPFPASVAVGHQVLFVYKEAVFRKCLHNQI